MLHLATLLYSYNKISNFFSFPFFPPTKSTNKLLNIQTNKLLGVNVIWYSNLY